MPADNNPIEQLKQDWISGRDRVLDRRDRSSAGVALTFVNGVREPPRMLAARHGTGSSWLDRRTGRSQTNRRRAVRLTFAGEVARRLVWPAATGFLPEVRSISVYTRVARTCSALLWEG